MNIPKRLAALRSLMKAHQVQAYLIPSTDAHQSEYVPTYWRRREWICGFTGSAGDVVVTMQKAAMWTDGRYYLQAEAQLTGTGIALMKVGLQSTPSQAAWIGKQLRTRDKVGIDPRLYSLTQFTRMRLELGEYGIELVGVEDNLVDMLWEERPAAPDSPIEVYPVRFAGERFQDKLRRIRHAMADAGVKAHVVSALDSIAWLFNIRGSDVQHNPVVIAYAIITDKAATLYVDQGKVTKELLKSFGKSVEIKAYDSFRAGLLQVAKSGGPVWIDPATTSQWVVNLVAPKAKLIRKDSPIVMMKAMKNKAELRGMKAAHVRDGVAMVRFLYWLDQNVGKIKLSEISVADKLEEIRSRSRLFRGVSFDSIVGYAEHGAIIHYSATPETNHAIKKHGILLVDSGAQYLDGTTDITRTIALSNPTVAQKDQFTRVLKGHIQIVTAVFPQGTAGRQLDTLARKALWDAGLDYAHGTGHGVGAYLSVHEGPQSISHSRDTGIPLVPGMIVSNEPGFYEAGSHGIRTENLVYVCKDAAHSDKNKSFFTFDNLTLCPIDTRMIDPRLLSPQELRYFNAYHAQVKKTLTPFLDKKEAAWLAKATRPVR